MCGSFANKLGSALMETENAGGFYSQHGEDILLSAVFAGKKDGYFVEIGGHDGRHLSNTLHFELAGWTGALVEAHPVLFAELQEKSTELLLRTCRDRQLG